MVVRSTMTGWKLQPGDEPAGRFSYTETPPLLKQRPCHITYTSEAVHDALRTGFDRSPMFNGRIKGIGPRYCPSIEDKIDRFADKERHQLFVEPEGWDTVEVYVNGFSSSLPEDVQYEALRKVEGFENCKMFRPGYAIEYDYFPPTQLSPTLETRLVKNLFFAGQINGTTGYEEAASQGLIAGINAHLAIHDEAPFILKRSEAYIGVLIDDLINKGTLEPYRMFTSRAEHRILLRQDNADIRLTPLAHAIGMNGLEERMERVEQKNEGIKQIEADACQLSMRILNRSIRILESIGNSPVVQKTKLALILSRPHIGIEDITPYLPQLVEGLASFDDETISLAEVNIKYRGYIEREQEMVDKMNRLEELALHDTIDYSKISSLSIESREKLARLRPRTLGQASRISGVSPSDISVLLVHMGR